MAKGLERIKGMLGFAMRAGKAVLGTDLILSSMSIKGKGRVWVVVISCEAADNAREKLTAKATHAGIPVVEVDIGMAELGKLLGKTYAPVAVAITDEGFAKEIVNAKASETISGKEVSENGNGI